MFGYVLPDRKELKIRELEAYQGYYCGLCLALKKQYHFFGRLSLNYDMAFLGLLLTSLYEPERQESMHRCMLHPGRKRLVVQNQYLEYAADMNILLTYYKCMDDWQDEHDLLHSAYGKLLFFSGKRVCKKYPQKALRIQGYLEELSAYEEKNSRNLDETAGCFGRICAELFTYDSQWEVSTQRIGFFLGKFIYLLDAYDDLERDREKGCYNPFLACGQREGFEEWVHGLLKMMMAEACREFEKLPIVEDADLLRNILYAGVWGKFFQIGEQRKKREKKGEKQEDKNGRPV
ncbi:hypothetical protein D7V86_06955 [bacterium D16-51]|nr:hypothetical protein D7V96_07385 [bacterium D16-59]RKI61048.1 hypothetical protein D7V86_06955 [bacterium D16-51]